MKKRLLALLTSLTLLCGITAAFCVEASAYVYTPYGYTVNARLNGRSSALVRSGPNPNYSAVGYVYSNQILYVTGYSGDCYRVSNLGGGYLPKSYVKLLGTSNSWNSWDSYSAPTMPPPPPPRPPYPPRREPPRRGHHRPRR